MRGFWLGALLGVAVGAGGMYLGMARPWQGDEVVQVDADAGAEPAPDNAGKNKRKRRRRKGKRRGAGDGQEELIDEVVEVSAADRKLVWRGQSVSLPPRDMNFEGGAGGRSLEQGEIDSGVSGGRSRIIQCIGSARGNAELSARITVKFLVNENGKVTRSRVEAPAYLQNNGLESCVRKATRAMRFPATGAATVVTVPFDLT